MVSVDNDTVFREDVDTKDVIRLFSIVTYLNVVRTEFRRCPPLARRRIVLTRIKCWEIFRSLVIALSLREIQQ